MSGFRMVGLNYVQYSNIAARMLRRALKPEKRADAAKREESHIKFTQWKDGKPVGVYNFNIYFLLQVT
ncbi:ATP synthase epsilon chain, putative [Pediculus humanus corporis]|uniref:ATP synthase epsilon chain, putative n=1 Tax=Pediculus humanus subsp. corporis TaxID=121224 RepID=E0W1U2_PEDHC|nr:ATP synthase epsilon chain, putative [Pediculus humanus corporis]EEB19674.1 ATP synthase epsilon chain, putative [Pediculus humanus corporis]